MTTYDYPTLYLEELQGMKERAVYYLNNHATKGEKRMAQNILKLVQWVECESEANRKKHKEVKENS